MEALKYLQVKNHDKGLQFHQIQHISGTNPLLLSHLRQEFAFLSDYEVKVNSKVNRFLCDNLVLDPDNKSIERFFSYKTCEKYIYYAYRGDMMTYQKFAEYNLTWLNKHHVTVLEDEVEDNKVVGKTLRLNFPPLGKKLLEILRKFMRESNDELIHKICTKERSFAGFLFEGKFHAYCASL